MLSNVVEYSIGTAAAESVMRILINNYYVHRDEALRSHTHTLCRFAVLLSKYIYFITDFVERYMYLL